MVTNDILNLDELVLQDNEVHLWILRLDNFYAYAEEFLSILSPDENIRSQRYHFYKDNRNFLVSRGILRKLLASYLKTTPEEIRFNYNPYGKPYINQDLNGHNLMFNISHSGLVVLLGFTLDRQIGLDVEYHSEQLNDFHFCKSFFSSREYHDLFSLPEDSRRKAFYNCWTRKEAFIKAIGEGLSFPLNEFDVSITSPAELLEMRQNPEEKCRWSMLDIGIDESYSAAMVIDGKNFCLKEFR